MTSMLFIGDLNPHTRTYQRYRALQDLGHQVVGLSFTPDGYQPGVSLQPSLLERVRYKLGYPTDPVDVNRKLMASCSQTCPDLVWIENAKMLRPASLRRIKQHCPETILVLYSNDNLTKWHNQSHWMKANLRIVDAVFLVHGYSAETLYRWGAKRVILFHRGYDRTYVTPRPPDTPFEHDVVFIGTYERARYLELLALAEQGISVTVFGNGWPESPHACLKIQQKPLFGEAFVDTMHRSKIVLNFLRKMNDDITTGRTFEIPGSGSFMLAERTQAQQSYFVEGQEAEFFGDTDELIRKVRYYLDHPEERMRIAQNGLRRCQHSGYSYHDRLQEMLEDLGD